MDAYITFRDAFDSVEQEKPFVFTSTQSLAPHVPFTRGGISLSDINHPIFKLRSPLPLTYEFEGLFEISLYDPLTDTYGIGPTMTEAIAEFTELLVDSYTLLAEDEPLLDQRLFDRLARFRAVLETRLEDIPGAALEG